MNEEIKKIEKRLGKIEQLVGNHLTEVIKKITKISTDVDWLKKFFWLVIGTTITTIIVALLTLVIK